MKVRFTSHDLAELDPPRELTAHERSVLRALVSATPDAASALCQINHALVLAECAQGCGTVELAPVSPKVCPRLKRENGPLAEGEWRSGQASAQTVLLHVEAGMLDYLETYRHDGQEEPLRRAQWLTQTFHYLARINP